MEFELYEIELIENLDKVVENFKNNLVKISVGRANPSLISNLKVMYYETLTPINELTNISVPEARQLLIKPFDMAIVKEIVNAINSSSLGLNAINEGHQIRINLPELTSERRKEMIKVLNSYTEQAKVSIRQVRQDLNKTIKANETISEDLQKHFLDMVQKIIDKYNNVVINLAQEKEKELMTI